MHEYDDMIPTSTKLAGTADPTTTLRDGWPARMTLPNQRARLTQATPLLGRPEPASVVRASRREPPGGC